MRYALILAWALLGACASASAQVSIEFGLPSVRIGIQLGGYPDLVAVPGYPVYYAPQLGSNLFFYDGLYWVYSEDRWYASSWYDGPWDMIAPASVPYFVLRVPVRYYRHPPVYFSGWGRDEPPRWGEHWGRDWDQQHRGWDHWDHASAPRPAPLPSYQRQYSGSRYPSADQQRAVRENNYHYQPHEAVVQQHYARPPAAAPPHTAESDRPPSAATHQKRSPDGESPVHAQQPAQQQPAHSQQPAQQQPAHAQQPAQQQPAHSQPPAQQQPAHAQQPAQQHEGQHAPQPAPQYQAPAPQGRAPAEKSQGKPPEHEQKKEPEHDH